MKNLSNPTQTLHFAFHLSDYKYIAECRVFVLNPTRTLHKTLHKVIRITLHRGVQNRAQNLHKSVQNPTLKRLKQGVKMFTKTSFRFWTRIKRMQGIERTKTRKTFPGRKRILSVNSSSAKPQRLSRSKAE